ncbi:MAG: hypothetical protein AAB869_01900, partial [Patescibacteria group bacterium]
HRKKQPSILEQVLKKSVGEARLSNGRSAKPSMVIVDAQLKSCVKNTDIPTVNYETPLREFRNSQSRRRQLRRYGFSLRIRRP